MEAVLENVDISAVHHMLLYECRVPDGQNADDLFGPYVGTEHGGICYIGDTPDVFEHCIGNYIFAWAIGSFGEILPDHIGVPIGEANKGASYFVLETHYDNPHLRDDLIDNSGMRFYLTDELRANDAGMLIRFL